MRWLKILGWVVGVVAAVIIAAGVALWLAPGPIVAWAIAHPVSALMGRDMRVAGGLAIKWGAPTRIEANDIHVANASWGSEPEMFSARHLAVTLFPASFIHGTPRIPDIELDGAKLLLEKSANGEGNWNFSAKQAAPKKRRGFPDLQHAVLRDSQILWRNGRTGAKVDLGVANFDYRAPDPTTPVTVAAAGTYAGSFEKLPLHLTATVGPLAELRNPEEPYPVKLDGSFGTVNLAIDGAVKEPLDFNGLDLRLSLSGKKLDTLASALGVPMPELPDFRGTSELTGGNGDFAIKSLTIALGKSDLEGGLAIDTNSRVPHVEANLTSRKIDLADFDGLVGGKPAHSSAAKPAPPPSDTRLIPNVPISVKKLPGINIDLSFYGTRIVSTTGLPFDAVALGLKLANGEITLDPLRFHTAKGDVALNAHFTPFTQDSPPKLGAKIDVQHVDLKELLRNSSSSILRETAGIVGGFVKIDTTGVSMREFLQRMNGDAGFFMQNGELSELAQQLAPIDVLGSLGVLAIGDRPQPINCLVTRFDIKKGVATATTLLFDTANTTVAGAGNVNFADETLYLTLDPKNKHFAPVSLRTPVDIEGTFKKPSFHLHLGGLAARLGAAAGLGVLFPPAALLPLIDLGLGEHNACATAYAAQNPPGEPQPKSGSSAPK